MADSNYKILLVDDEDDLLEITASILEMEGYNLATANSVQKAIEIISQTVPDIIVSDITMPGLSGFDLLSHVRSLPQLQNTPFIFLTAHADIESIKTGKELGIDDYLTKPVDYHLLLSTIKGKLKRKEELKQAFAVQSDQFKNQILRLISHEMRTPLTSILGATELLSDTKETFSENELKGFLEMLQNSSKRLTSMVDDFLTAMKIESGEILREIVPMEYQINAHSFFDTMVKTELSSRLQSFKVDFVNACPDQPVTVITFMPHLEEIIKRLLDNAIKFSTPGSKVVLTLTRQQDFVTFSVQDYGCGIPKGKQEMLYSKFNQINRDKNEQQGAGLGLYIASQLAKANRATLWFESEEGKGSTFFVKVPAPSNAELPRS